MGLLVYRSIARETIEQTVVGARGAKAKLFRGVIDDGDLRAPGLPAEDVRGLLA